MLMNELKDQIPDFARDVRTNLAAMLADKTLPPKCKCGLLLAVAIATRNHKVISAMECEARSVMTPDAIAAVKSAAFLIAMNNVYNRFVRLASNPEYRKMPARLRQDLIDSSNVDRGDLELWSLAISAINGCDALIDEHETALQQEWFSPTEIQTAVRFAAIMQSVAISIETSGNVRF